MLTELLLGACSVLLLLYALQRKRKQRLLQDMGIPVDPPSFIFGNLRVAFKVGLMPKMKEWWQKYGDLYGYYEGTVPVIVTSDPDLVHNVFIKEFRKFHGRKLFILNERDAPSLDMFQAAGDRWKRLRTVVNPTFSGKQMKAMSPLINQTLDHFLAVIDQHAADGKSFDICQVLGRLSLDVIGCCAFGIDINALQNPDEIFLQKAREIFEVVERKRRSLIRVFVIIGLFFKSPAVKLHRMFMKTIRSPRAWFLDAADKVIAQRKEHPTDRTDFIKLMMDAMQNTRSASETELVASMEEEEKTTEEPLGTKELHKTEETRSTDDDKSVRGMTIDEIKAQCTLFLLAGYETTSTTMSLMCHQLAVNPDIQNKLQQEIDTTFGDNEPDYTSIKGLTYMDMVIKETLRFYPVAQIALTRECFEEYRYKDLVIKPGMMVQAHTDILHKSPDLWGPEDPEHFIPERFAADRKRHPAAWVGFGLGPRNCIGMRFAYMEMKMTMARLLRWYSILSCQDTKDPLPLKKNAVVGPAEGVHVIVKKRDVS